MNQSEQINILLTEIKRLKAIAEVGLLYCKNEYDIERYHEVHASSLRMLNQISGHDIDTLKVNLPMSTDYPTVKVDVRCLILNDEKKVLLVKESVDGKWSLPGGWADIGQSPKEVAIKEAKEETGLDVEVRTLLAVFDKKMHPHPPEAFYVYKLMFHCHAISLHLSKGFDVLDAEYFDISALPELSENRILKSQIEIGYQKIIAGNRETYFD